MNNITDIIEAVKAVRTFAEVINASEVSKEDMESLATLSPTLKEGLDSMNKWIGGNE